MLDVVILYYDPSRLDALLRLPIVKAPSEKKRIEIIEFTTVCNYRFIK
jgi:hypothetical protein